MIFKNLTDHTRLSDAPFFIGIPEAGEEHQILVHWLVMKEMINLAEMYTK